VELTLEALAEHSLANHVATARNGEEALDYLHEAEYLTNDGHTVETASNGSEALEKLRWTKFDLLMADKAMPQMNGAPESKLALIRRMATPCFPFVTMASLVVFQCW
jgi:DNA-binding NtrC family response regulator